MLDISTIGTFLVGGIAGIYLYNKWLEKKGVKTMDNPFKKIGEQFKPSINHGLSTKATKVSNLFDSPALKAENKKMEHGISDYSKQVIGGRSISKDKESSETYTITRRCTNCNEKNEFEVPKGKEFNAFLAEKNAVCFNCGVELTKDKEGE